MQIPVSLAVLLDLLVSRFVVIILVLVYNRGYVQCIVGHIEDAQWELVNEESRVH